MEEQRSPLAIIAIMLILAGLFAFYQLPSSEDGNGSAPAQVPTLMPTPALTIPTAAPAPLVNVQDSPGTTITYSTSNTTYDVDVCIGFCP